MIKKLYIQYEKEEQDNKSVMYIADPDKKLETGNIEIVKTLIGKYADDTYKELTEEKTSKRSFINELKRRIFFKDYSPYTIDDNTHAVLFEVIRLIDDTARELDIK